MKADINSNYFFQSSFIFILYLSAILGFYLGEDSTGGAFLDYTNQKYISQNFANNFYQAFLNYDNYNTRHSPVLIILLSFFEKLNLGDTFIRLINFHFCLLLPLFFFKCLKEKFPEVNKSYLLLFSGLIFLSPTYRTLSIWPDSRIYGLIFFTISIYFFLSFLNKKSYAYALYVTFFYSISSYFSPNFSLFSIYFFYFFVKNLKLNELIYLVLINLALAFPAFFYIFILDINFLLKTAVPAGQINTSTILNFSNKILIISTIVLFHTIPFLVLKIISFDVKKIFCKKNIFIPLILIYCILVYFFNYEFEYTGGGFFFKLSTYLFDNNILFFLISFISILYMFLFSKNNFENLILLTLLILSNPQLSIYHKYYDPLILILFLTIFNLNFNYKNLFNDKSIIIFYSYSLFFLIISLMKKYIIF